MNLSNVKEIFMQKDILEYCLNEADKKGFYLEFGVATGGTIKNIARIASDKVYGFDSFEGNPEKWNGFEVGAFRQDNIPVVDDNVELIIGYFDDTVKEFFKNKKKKIAFMHIDCDLYSSTKTVFDGVSHLVKGGTIILFDEYYNYDGYEDHEKKAFEEFVKDNGLEFDYIAYNPNHQQVAVRIK